MVFKEIIETRKSVRTFDDGAVLGDETLEALRGAIAGAHDPFGGRYTIELRKYDLRGPQSPGTYGTISGASWYLLMGIKDDVMSAIGAGYAMEQVVLKATELGLGTCWMALTFKGADFMKGVEMPADEPLRIVSPVGYPAGRRRVIESITRMTMRSSSRKPMNDMFWQGDFGRPVAEDSLFYEALAMMRLAPSAKNSQPWRALVKDNAVWFYYEKKSDAAPLDLGIGLCHFDLIMRSAGQKGQWSPANEAPSKKDLIPAVKYTLPKAY